jgi:hypothetical protein
MGQTYFFSLSVSFGFLRGLCALGGSMFFYSIRFPSSPPQNGAYRLQ